MLLILFRERLLIKLGDCCMKQAQYHLACQKYTQAGDKEQVFICSSEYYKINETKLCSATLLIVAKNLVVFRICYRQASSN